MGATVSEVLEDRLHAGEPPKGLVPVLSLLAHAAFLLGLAWVSRPSPMALVPPSVPIRLVSPAALARVGSSRRPEAAPAAPKTRPVIEKIQPEPVVVPSAKALPDPKSREKPKKEKPKPEPKPAVAAARPAGGSEGPALELPSAGSPTGEAGGTSSFGTSVSSFDADFPFAYYVDQLLSLIGANWLKPNVADGTACVVFFRIQRSGQVTDVRVETPSPLPYYDRAAARALYAANPLPPLPPEFKAEQLGVHLRFQ